MTLVLPCYNEGRIFNNSVETIVKTLEENDIEYEIIFVDDKSPDETVQLINKAIKVHKNMRAIFHAKNMGRGSAVCDGILASTSRFVGYIDIDLEISPSYIPSALLLLQKGGCDIVCARRHYDFTIKHLLRDMLHYFYKIFASFIISLPISDPNAGFKFFERKKILPIIEKTKDKHWFWDTEVTKRASLAGLALRELDVLYRQNPAKKSSVRVFSDVKHFVSKLFWLRAELAHEAKR